MTDLWPDFSSVKEAEENLAVDILREQARALEKKTNNKVKATFSKISYKSGTDMSQIGRVLSSITSQVREEVIDDELKGKQDVSELYLITKYKFEIYNDTYRFRVFVLNNSVLFPISLDIDEGIKSELSFSHSDAINSNSELQDLLAAIFSCQKMKTIVMSMMKK